LTGSRELIWTWQAAAFRPKAADENIAGGVFEIADENEQSAVYTWPKDWSGVGCFGSVPYGHIVPGR
jgi:hypothetical protein